MVSALDDPHSMILSGDKYESFMQSTSGEYGGIGVVIGADRKNVTRIISVFPGSSAEKNGLQSGDIIKRVNDEDVSALSYRKFLTGSAEKREREYPFWLSVKMKKNYFGLNAQMFLCQQCKAVL